jgi:probable O-glycosylation ligase (exosortase A-associated)
MVENIKNTSNQFNALFNFLIVYIIFDYGRPQELLNIGFLRPQLILNLILIYLIYQSRVGFFPQVKQIKLMWTFVLLLACYIPFARNNYFAFATTRNQLVYMFFILSMFISVQSFRRLKTLILIFVCLMGYVSIYSIFHGGMGPGNYFQDENDVALYINIWLPFCFYLLLIEKKKFHRLIYLTGLLSGLLAIVISFSRGGFVGLVAVGIVIWSFSKKKITTLLIILFCCVFLVLFAPKGYWEEMSTIDDTKENTASERIESWKTAWIMFLDKPLGVGGNNFQVWFPQYQTQYFKRGMWGRVAHSIWFTLIPELGIFGIILYFYLIHINVKSIYEIKINSIEHCDDERHNYLHSLSLAFLASLSGYFASGSFLSVLYYAHYWYITALIVVSLRIHKKLLVQI